MALSTANMVYDLNMTMWLWNTGGLIMTKKNYGLILTS